MRSRPPGAAVATRTARIRPGPAPAPASPAGRPPRDRREGWAGSRGCSDCPIIARAQPRSCRSRWWSAMIPVHVVDRPAHRVDIATASLFSELLHRLARAGEAPARASRARHLVWPSIGWRDSLRRRGRLRNPDAAARPSAGTPVAYRVAMEELTNSPTTDPAGGWHPAAGASGWCAVASAEVPSRPPGAALTDVLIGAVVTPSSLCHPGRPALTVDPRRRAISRVRRHAAVGGRRRIGEAVASAASVAPSPATSVPLPGPTQLPDGPFASSGALVVLGADGALTLVAADGRATPLAPADENPVTFPAWSPDGTRIAAIRLGAGSSEIVASMPAARRGAPSSRRSSSAARASGRSTSRGRPTAGPCPTWPRSRTACRSASLRRTAARRSMAAVPGRGSAAGTRSTTTGSARTVSSPTSGPARTRSSARCTSTGPRRRPGWRRPAASGHRS